MFRSLTTYRRHSESQHLALLINVSSSFQPESILKAFNININLQFKTMPKDRMFRVGYRVVTLMADNLLLESLIVVWLAVY